MELRRTNDPKKYCFYLEAAMLPESNLSSAMVFRDEQQVLSNHEHSAHVLKGLDGEIVLIIALSGLQMQKAANAAF